MARLPGIRELEVYLPVQWRCPAGWRRAQHAAQQGRLRQRRGADRGAQSPVRKEMRADYAKLPAFSGRVTHYPMATSVIRGGGT